MLISAAYGQTTTIYFIRHAEKADESKDSDLSAEGKERAKQWAAFFADKNIAVIYSTPYKRTMHTASPLSQQNKIDLLMYEASKPDFTTILKKYKGKTILIVGHSNTIPDYINKLVHEKQYTDIDENEYNHLYTITVNGSYITSKLEKI